MDTFHAPWRMQYIQSLGKKSTQPTCGCFLCDANAADLADRALCQKRLLLWRSEHSLCLINRYPYTSGHLLVAPRAHKSDLEDLTPEELNDFNVQTVRALKLLRTAFKPQGFNIGINLGQAAGAGLPGHLHQHIISRWAGDTNFISVVGNTRIVPHDMETLWTELAKHVEAENGHQ